MKLICVIGFMVMCASAFGGFKVPSGIFEASELEKAKVEALEKKKPLAFVYTDPGTSWGPCVAASLAAFKRLKSKTVVVLIRSKQAADVQMVSPVVYTGFSNSKIGYSIPRLTIVTPAMDKVLVSLGKSSISDERQLKKGVDGARKLFEDAGAGGEMSDQKLKWPLKKDGFYNEGIFRSYDGNTLEIDKGGKRNVKLSKNTLSAGSIAYAEECMKKLGKTVANDEADSEARAYEVESWTGSTQGKKIEGKFVSLDGSDLTLEKSNGKAMTFDVKFLSAESRERAEKYAAKVKP